ncbi:bifunctional diaminohydroxyphosphoribosylaminopyrimidine deaminase/5-amino-6-(5-phosphoribosylamino)uracil reductase RibD [Salegentibacter salarius]|uniref:Riboflavin biosynthesis protein RibD n=1 Tax=Salegentibacter salarius TaxID=435906 RepID=A0A2N0TXR5_9FLAO|nr:bifunctional diaminohydroxyphosphoribosylaminopyrimidine deaminase/5-amino-6-(5-phosphoribosylamino)uracil reductase RibD [Salegentibacter salarius]OEY73205.1 riboflavin biosynthesis protein RibD [Salegentibacter salarius]PKD19537.1 riboflavin biosynthesis protein RibD [Salegentibacter salarius]SLJ98708.1 diaminohydroxyphosphoribosylaminopyrimidine deaminase [Salegentibacter salarius]
MNIHEKYIKRCIELAKNGLEATYPNPLVGSVIVHKDRIIGEGWHQKAGAPHAEVNAVNSVKDESLLKKSTIYVSLEPCSHFGKTPPCSDLIIAKGIKKVVIGTVDPFAEVAGRGIKKLMEAGCEVKVGVLEKECQKLNKRFFTFHQKKRPYIILKWAQTADGFIAPKIQEKREPVWITNQYSKQLVHKWRSKEQAILVGTNTAIADNPKLNTRLWKGENPVRVVIDKELKIPQDSELFDGTIKTIVLTDNVRSSEDNLMFEKLDFQQNLPEQICEVLYRNNLQSVIIEGGAKTLQTFIDANLWDEARVFTGISEFHKGVKAPEFSGKMFSETTLERDTLKIYKND